MEDYIKHKLSDYKPTFKEDYWNTMAGELKKRKRRKIIVFWWLGTIGILLVAAIIYLYDLPHGDSNMSGQAVAFEQIDPSINPGSPNFEPISPINKSVEEQKSIKTKKGLTKTPNNTEPSSNSIKLLTKTPDASQKDPIKNQYPETTKESITQSKIPTSSVEQVHQTNISGKSNEDRQLTNRMDGLEDEKVNQGLAQASGTSKRSSAHSSSTLAPIGIQKLQLLEMHASFPDLPKLNHVKVVISESRFTKQQYAISLAENLMNTSDNDLIHNEEIRFQRVVHFGQSAYYLTAGVGVGRYTGNFSAVDQESFMYRSFASNTMTQSLIPQSAYYINMPFEFGLNANRWQVGITFSPEYLLGLHGQIKSQQTTNTVQPNEIVPTAGAFSLIQEVNQSEKEAWLDQSNVNAWAFPAGANIQYKLNNHWVLGASAQFYTTGFYKLKSPVLKYRNITGNTDQMKGGLYVSYQF